MFATYGDTDSKSDYIFEFSKKKVVDGKAGVMDEFIHWSGRLNHSSTYKSITLVTALYDIQRETKGDGRKFSDYLECLPCYKYLEQIRTIFRLPAQDRKIQSGVDSTLAVYTKEIYFESDRELWSFPTF